MEFFASAASTSGMSLFKNSSFQIRNIDESEKLNGHKNFRKWRKMGELDLKAANLIAFIESQFGEKVIVTLNQREVLDAQARLYLKASVTKSIANRLDSVNDLATAFDAFEQLKKWYSGSKTMDLVSLHYRFCKLRFKQGFDPERFITGV